MCTCVRTHCPLPTPVVQRPAANPAPKRPEPATGNPAANPQSVSQRDFCETQDTTSAQFSGNQVNFPPTGDRQASRIQSKTIAINLMAAEKDVTRQLENTNLDPAQRESLEAQQQALAHLKNLMLQRPVQPLQTPAQTAAFQQALQSVLGDIDQTSHRIATALADPQLSPDRRGRLENKQQALQLARNALANGTAPNFAEPAHQSAFTRALTYPLDNPYLDNNDAEVLDLSTPCQVKNFLNSYAQVDQAIGSQDRTRAYAENQCTAASLVAAALLIPKTEGLKAMIDVMQTKETLPTEDQQFLNGLSQRIQDNKVTRGDIERLQDTLARQLAKAVNSEDHRLMTSEFTRFFQGSDFSKLMDQNGLSIWQEPGHSFLKIDDKTFFEPWPRSNGQIVTDPEEVKQYHDANTTCINNYTPVNPKLEREGSLARRAGAILDCRSH